MRHEEIVTRLSLKLVNIAASPSEIVYAMSMQSILTELAHRLDTQALALTPAELFKARAAVRAAIRDHLNADKVIAIGLDRWAAERRDSSSTHTNRTPRKEHIHEQHRAGQDRVRQGAG